MRSVNRISRPIPWLLAFILVTGAFWSPPLRAPEAIAAANVDTLYSSAPDAPDFALQQIIEDEVAGLPGDWGVAVKKLDTGQYAVYNGDVQQVSASLYKLWVLCELYHQASAGAVSLDDESTVTADDAYYDALLDELRIAEGTSIDLKAAARLMVTLSDNTAAHLLVRVLGPDNITRYMRELGLTNSVLDWSGGGDNLTTPLDIMKVLESIATSHMVDAGASRQIINLMLGQQINNLLPPGLPDGTPFAHKTGALGALLHDAGIVYSPNGPYVIVVMASHLDDYGTAWDHMPALSQRVYDYFTSRPHTPARYFTETRQSVGHDFLKFWNAFGGLPVYGFPIGPERLSNGLLVQDFERARFEWHGDLASQGGGQSALVLGLVGQERAGQLRLTWPPSPDTGAGMYFDGTGQSLSGEFLAYWLNHGGERVFGWPISPAQTMTSPVDGQARMMQWFQRARMEIHPERPPGERMVLAALGSELASGQTR